MITYNDYSLDRKTEVLALVAANGGNVQQTSRETGIPHQTIRFWLANEDRFSEFQSEKLASLDSKLDKTVNRYLDSIYDHDLSNTPLNHKATAFGVVFDKLQLVRGLPTSITETVERHDVAIILQSALSQAIEEDEREAIDLTLDE